MRGNKKTDNDTSRGAGLYRPDLLMRAQECWGALVDFRIDRLRNKRFTYGDQWGDVTEVDNKEMREDEHLRRRGRVPLKNNLIRRLVRNVLGVFRDRYKLPECHARDAAEADRARVMQALLQCNADTNRLAELYARTMEEFLISGLAVHKKWYGCKGNRTDCWTDLVQSDSFFVDTRGRDVRGWDVSLIGEIHDMTPQDMVSTFARRPEDVARIESLYGSVDDTWAQRSRVWEVWVREHPGRWHCHDRRLGRCWKMEDADYRRLPLRDRERIEARWFVDDEWHYYFLTSEGEVLASGRSPYRHGSHPYVFKAHPFVDGEIHSFVEAILDQQKLTNRLISMYDWILQASAKGVLLMPESALPEGVALDDVADEWSRFDGVIVFRPHVGHPLPQQISSKAVDIGITELLNIQMKMMEDISGVNGALQGKLESGSVSGTLYNQQTRNSLTALADLMMSFEDFIAEATGRDASNIGQYYTEGRIRRVCGGDATLGQEGNFNCDHFDFKF